jgi:hypothetical protein
MVKSVSRIGESLQDLVRISVESRYISTMPKRRSLDDPKQAAAFRKAARELGADKSDERFKDVLRKIAKPKPTHPPKKHRSG